VLGRAEYASVADRKAIVDAFRSCLRNPPPEENMCFNPRHSIKFIGKKRTREFVICFECMNYHELENGKRVGGGLVNASGRKTLNALLRREGAPLSPGAESKD
jgi:hypothetical protein